MISITPEEITLLSKYVNDITGIKLDSQKGYLLESRFQSLLTEYQCSSYKDLYRKAQNDQTGSLMNQMIDAITTNETYFFRDSKPFELLSNKIIPDLIDRKRNETGEETVTLKIWSAACSTGQEIYSIGITLHEMLKNLNLYNISILGTDISDDVIAKASYGQYNRFEVERGLPTHYLNKYFTKTANGWRIKDMIRTMARFEKRDLNKPFQQLGKFDIIFCRNVAIYFDNRDKKKLFQKIGQSLLPGGALIVGASESLTGIAADFEAKHYLRSMYYQLKGETNAAPAAVKQPATQTPQKTRAASSFTEPRPPALKPANTARPDPGQKLQRQSQQKPQPEKPRLKPQKRTPQTPPDTSTAIQKNTGDKSHAGTGRSLLSAIQNSDSRKKSLLERIRSNADIQKTSLLDEISEQTDHSKK